MNSPVKPDDTSIQRPEPVQDQNWYAEVLLALPPEGTFSYRIPEAMLPVIQAGQGVQVPFGSRRTLTGIIRSIHSGDAVPEGIRDIQALENLRPIVNEAQFALWSWIADYYMCSEGEVMKAAISAGLKPEHPARHSHEIRISLSDRLSDKETLAKEMALLHRRAPIRAALM
ncbi:MAG: hypothetical protein PHS48_08660, partial [Bacteroidales bacterium]|nr:hypothetical protein [Bacteroidales bacterium]